MVLVIKIDWNFRWDSY